MWQRRASGCSMECAMTHGPVCLCLGKGWRYFDMSGSWALLDWPALYVSLAYWCSGQSASMVYSGIVWVWLSFAGGPNSFLDWCCILLSTAGHNFIDGIRAELCTHVYVPSLPLSSHLPSLPFVLLHSCGVFSACAVSIVTVSCSVCFLPLSTLHWGFQ